MPSVRRQLAALTLAGAVAAGAACTAPSPGAAPAATSTPVGSEPPPTAGQPHESELSPRWDQSPDGPPPVADEDLTEAELRALLRTRASAADGPERCTPAELEGGFGIGEAALGHRYTSLTVRNTGQRRCTVEGVPGVGARGTWGHRFTLEVHPGIPQGDHRGPVALEPGEEASALVEWTGALAGAEEETASLLVFQLARGQAPLPVAAELRDGQPFDLGMTTTVHLSPFEPARG